jgi:hypothetical protein
VLVCSDDIVSPLRSFNPGLLCRGRSDFSCPEAWMRRAIKVTTKDFLMARNELGRIFRW